MAFKFEFFGTERLNGSFYPGICIKNRYGLDVGFYANELAFGIDILFLTSLCTKKVGAGVIGKIMVRRHECLK